MRRPRVCLLYSPHYKWMTRIVLSLVHAYFSLHKVVWYFNSWCGKGFQNILLSLENLATLREHFNFYYSCHRRNGLPVNARMWFHDRLLFCNEICIQHIQVSHQILSKLSQPINNVFGTDWTIHQPKDVVAWIVIWVFDALTFFSDVLMNYPKVSSVMLQKLWFRLYSRARDPH